MNIDLNAIIVAKILNGGGGGGGSYPWFGPGTELVGRKLEKTINLKNDTTFDSWTASTTTGTIKAKETQDEFAISDDYDYAFSFVEHFYADVAFLAGATLKNTVKRFTHVQVTSYYPIFTQESSLDDGYNSSKNTTIYDNKFIRYYGSTEGTLETTGTSYGPMYTAIGGIGYTSGGVYYRTPAINARCKENYFSTDRKSEVDSANTNMVITVDVYKTPVADFYANKFVELQRADLKTVL